jgi:hypothetical protein
VLQFRPTCQMQRQVALTSSKEGRRDHCQLATASQIRIFPQRSANRIALCRSGMAHSRTVRRGFSRDESVTDSKLISSALRPRERVQGRKKFLQLTNALTLAKQSAIRAKRETTQCGIKPARDSQLLNSHSCRVEKAQQREIVRLGGYGHRFPPTHDLLSFDKRAIDDHNP